MPTLAITDLRVRSLDVDRAEVTWELGQTYDDPRDYTMTVWRSESPRGPFEAITQEFEDRYIFVDARVPRGDRFRQLWYKLVVKNKADTSTVEYGPASLEPEPDLIAAYIRRSEMTLFTQVTGRLIWLFKRRTFGMRCPSCYDRVSGKKLRSNCPTCFSTSFLRGYHDPMEVWVQIDPAAKAQQNQAQQAAQHQATTARTSFFPNIVPGDVLVEAENRRWSVLTVQMSERLRAPIKQELTMRAIERTDIEYTLPINLDRALRDIQPSPARMFTNPTQLANTIDERTPNLFANYETYPKDPTQ